MFCRCRPQAGGRCATSPHFMHIFAQKLSRDASVHPVCVQQWPSLIGSRWTRWVKLTWDSSSLVSPFDRHAPELLRLVAAAPQSHAVLLLQVKHPHFVLERSLWCGGDARASLSQALLTCSIRATCSHKPRPSALNPLFFFYPPRAGSVKTPSWPVAEEENISGGFKVEKPLNVFKRTY